VRNFSEGCQYPRIRCQRVLHTLYSKVLPIHTTYSPSQSPETVPLEYLGVGSLFVSVRLYPVRFTFPCTFEIEPYLSVVFLSTLVQLCVLLFVSARSLSHYFFYYVACKNFIYAFIRMKRFYRTFIHWCFFAEILPSPSSAWCPGLVWGWSCRPSLWWPLSPWRRPLLTSSALGAATLTETVRPSHGL
jgi:hypothetical protein